MKSQSMDFDTALKIGLLLVLIPLGTMACNQQIPSSPAGSLTPYTPAQLKTLEKWELRNRVDREQRLAPNAVEMTLRQQMRHRFPQPLVRYRAGVE